MIEKIPVLNKAFDIFSKYLENKSKLKTKKLNKFDLALIIIALTILCADILFPILLDDKLGSYWIGVFDTILKYFTT